VQVRRVALADWEVVRDVLLRALAASPEAFGSTYDREVAFPKSVWLDRHVCRTYASTRSG
jgi:hypothetical protein